QHPRARTVADDRGALGRQVPQLVDDLVARVGEQDLDARLEEVLDTLPRVADDARTRAGRLEHPGRRRITVADHAAAVDVEGRQRGAVERVVIAGEHVA